MNTLLLEEAFDIAWDYLDRTGEVEGVYTAGRIVSDIIERMIRRGITNKLLLANKAIDQFKLHKSNAVLIREPAWFVLAWTMLGWGKKPDTPPEPDPGQPVEAERLLQIKNLCWMARTSAATIASSSEENLEDEFTRYEYDRFAKLMLEATRLAGGITDEFHRDSALRFLIGPLMAAGREPQARKLFETIQVDIIKASVLKNYPRLGANDHGS
jgi:hypothetical protein